VIGINNINRGIKAPIYIKFPKHKSIYTGGLINNG